MDSLFLQQKTQNLLSSIQSSGSGDENIPAWKLPLTSSLIGNSRHPYHNDKTPETPLKVPSSPKKVTISPELAEDEATAQLIQILLPCIICNRTFSPEALERHSKICTTVNEKSPHKSNRGKFDSAEQRKKDTKLADFIPPPEIDSNGEFIRQGSRRFRDSFSRGSKSRSSLGKSSTSTSLNINSNSASLIPTWRKGPVKPSHSLLDGHGHNLNNKSIPGLVHGQVEPFEENSEFGSEESQDAVSNAENTNLPHYARALSPSEDCPYCGRNFGMKAFDRHVNFCKEIYMRKQYETQPIPEEKKEAMERQELRTKYRQMKGSNSCGSLRSMSPPKDFPSMMAMKLYGFMNKTFNRNNFKKSNESLTNSCYGDYTRSMRRTSPAPSTMSMMTNMGHMTPKTKIYPGMYQRSNSTLAPSTLHSKHSPVMKVNTTSNIPKRTKSIENLASPGVQCSGYGQTYSNSNNSHGGGGGGNSFTRNSKTRSSLHKNFFRNSAKRVEPEGTENTTQSTSPGALIITPMSFYSKGKNYKGNSSSTFLEQQQQQHDKLEHSLFNHNSINRHPLHHHHNSINNIKNHHNDYHMEEHSTKKGLVTSDPHYDPYEKAARQFEELLKTQPTTQRINNNKQQSRKVGLDRAFRSVIPEPPPDYNDPPQICEEESRFDKNCGGVAGAGVSSRNYSNEGDKMELNSFGGGHPPTNDRLLSYWEQILQADNLKSQDPQEDSQAISSDSDNSKSRAVSNISSIDSAFSRSDGADLEFEALENLMSIGDGSTSQSKSSILPNVVIRPSQTQSENVSSSVHSQQQPRPHLIGVSEMTPTLPQLSNHQHEPHNKNSFHNSNYENYENGSATILCLENKLTKSNVAGSGSTSNGGGALARFCYECGTCYPTSTAKFCPECGERRVMK